MSDEEPLHVRFRMGGRPKPAPEGGDGKAAAPPEGVHRDGEPLAICLAPDVCLTPIGSQMVPIPYQVIGKADDAENFSGTVTFRGSPAMRFNSALSRTYGAEAGTGGGVVSGTQGGRIAPTSHSSSVFIEGQPVIRHGDRVTMNGGNTIGEIVLMRDRAVYDKAADARPAGADAAAPEPDWWSGSAAGDRAATPGAQGSDEPLQRADAPIGEWATAHPQPMGAMAEGAQALAALWQRTTAPIGEWAVAHPRTMGAMQVAGGVAEAVGSAALFAGGTAADATGVGAPVGVGLQAPGAAEFFTGADHAAEGLQQLWTGTPQETAAQHVAGTVADGAGASRATMEQIKAYTGAAQTVVGGVAGGIGATGRAPAGAAGAGARSAEDGVRITGKGIGSSRSSNSAAIDVARADQIQWGYAADEWEMRTIKAGDRIFGGLPGQSSYYTNAETLVASGANRTPLFESLQVRPHPEFGFRPTVGEYEAVNDLHVPFGTVRANPQFGPGGGKQYFIQDYGEGLRLVDVHPLGK